MEIKLGENIKELRKNSGYTQEDLAQVLGVSYQAVSRWESGNGYPDISLLPSIAEFFDVTLDELMYDSTITRERLQEEYHNLAPDEDPQKRLALARRLAKWNAQPYIWELLHQDRPGPAVTEEVRTLSKEYLKTAGVYGRTLMLGELVRLEDEDKMGIWLDCLPADAPWDNTRNKALMSRYMDEPHGDPEKYKGAMQNVLCDAVWDVYMCLCGYGKSTKEGLAFLYDLFNLLSPDPHDAFCKDRIQLLFALSRSSFSEGEKESGYRYLEEAEKLCEWLFSHHRDDEIAYSHPLLAGKTVKAAYLQSPILITIHYGRKMGETFEDAIEKEERFQRSMGQIAELCRQANRSIFIDEAK